MAGSDGRYTRTFKPGRRTANDTCCCALPRQDQSSPLDCVLLFVVCSNTASHVGDIFDRCYEAESGSLRSTCRPGLPGGWTTCVCADFSSDLPSSVYSADGVVRDSARIKGGEPSLMTASVGGLFQVASMSAHGPWRTRDGALQMSAFGAKADIFLRNCPGAGETVGSIPQYGPFHPDGENSC